MRKTLTLAVFALFFLSALPLHTFAATTAKTSVSTKTTVAKKPVVKAPAKKVVKKPVKKVAVAKKVVKKKVVACGGCRSKAEGVDNSKASKAAQWSGTVIGINEGEKSLVITESTKLNHIKAFAQRSVRITDDTKIINPDGLEQDFTNMDIGYRIEVHGVYDAKKRIVQATAIEIVKIPEGPITKTK